MLRRRRVMIAVLLVVLVFAVALAVRARRRRVTFVEVAPLVYARCAPCHRPGESGPFSLLTHSDVARRRRQIRRVVASGYMPPWKPVAGYGRYLHDRSLTPEERSLLLRWIDAGAPVGDPSATPPPPRWPTGWQLGTPDVVLPMPVAFQLPADGPDVYRNFVFAAPVAMLRYVAAWEFRAGGRAIHHAIVSVDRMEWARRRDAEDPEPGFGGMDIGNTQSPDGFYLVWAPGQTPAPPVPGSSWRIDGRTDLVLQLHLHPTGRVETVRPTIGLFFAAAPPTTTRMTFRIGDQPIDIPAGVPRWTMTDRVTLPVDVVMLRLFPHAHYLARQMRSWATLPDGRTEWLLRIDDWDLAWQDAYTFARPVALPRGSAVSMEFIYDNSENNERNPNSPPRRVVTGEQSVNEMGNITFEVSPRDPRDFAALQAFKFSRMAGPRAEYNLANALLSQGRYDEAAGHYRHVTTLDPSLHPAWFNLGVALSARRDLAGAVDAYRGALRVRPDDVGTHLALGEVLHAMGSNDDARAAYARALALSPGLPAALAGLATLGAPIR